MGSNLKSLIKLHEWNLDERRRELGDLLREHDALVNQKDNLLRQVEEEQKIAHQSQEFLVGASFGPFVMASRMRREELDGLIEAKNQEVEDARDRLNAVFRELKTYEITQANRERKEELELERKEQGFLDEMGMLAHRRKDA